MKGGIVVKCLDRFKVKMALTGSSIREDKINSSKMILDKTFDDDASFNLGVYFWELGLVNSEDFIDRNTIPIRLYGRKYSNANGETVKFQTLNNTPVVVGDIIYCSKSQEYFICTESFDIDGIHWQGKFTLCNWILKWQDENGDILQYPCFEINATQYNSGEQSNKLYTIGSSQHLIKLPCDENTVALRTPQRFMIDKNSVNPVTYMVTQNDTTTYNKGSKGIVLVTVLEHPVNKETDRVDLGICDYKEPSYFEKDNSNSNNDNTVSKSVIEYKSKIIKSGGNAQTFVAKFYDENNNEATDVLPMWNIVCDFSDELIVEKIDNKIMISIDNDNYVDDEFKLILSDTNGNYQSSLIVTIKSLL